MKIKKENVLKWGLESGQSKHQAKYIEIFDPPVDDDKLCDELLFHYPIPYPDGQCCLGHETQFIFNTSTEPPFTVYYMCMNKDCPNYICCNDGDCPYCGLFSVEIGEDGEIC